jgi:hypothetical protein
MAQSALGSQRLKMYRQKLLTPFLTLMLGSSLLPGNESGAATIAPNAAPEFWSFQPLQNPAPPRVGNSDWVKSQLDDFVLARIEQEGLVPVPAADKRTLIRRATLDLTGLPPTPEEIHAFVQDTSAEAFATVVDRLLASPHYGERWGRHWLDVIRFGEEDITGMYNVPYENAWRFRDWIVDKFNQDVPYDLFLQAQIAGDVLADDCRLTEKYGDLIPGLGLLGIGPWHYSNSVPQESRADERDDRIDVVTRGFLGLTVTCARCHDHKYDPISMEDYYALSGVFRNTAYLEYPLVSDHVVADFDEKKKKRDEVKNELKAILDEESKKLTGRLVSEISRYWASTWKVVGPQQRELIDVVREDGLDEEQLGKWVRYVTSPFRDHPFLQPWDDLIARGGTLEEARKVGDEYQALVISVIEEKKRIEEEVRAAYEERSEKYKELTKGKPQPKPRRTNLPNEYVAHEPVIKDPDAPELPPIDVEPIPRDRYNVWADLFDVNRALEDYNAKERRVVLYKDRELDRFLDDKTLAKVKALRVEIAALDAEIPKPRITTRFSRGPAFSYAMAVKDRDELETQRMHVRGNHDVLGKPVSSRFISALSNGKPEPFKKGSGRLELARSIAHHPLAARVLVNRVWMHHFGKGIVDTPSNFGELGSRPTHPRLLEYLAYRFTEGGWSIKALHREILLSATYQLSNEASTHNRRLDPNSRFYWRASRRRLEVEAMRDSLSFVAGTLERRLGGPSHDLGPEFRRRTIYGRVSRFKVSSALDLFDFPDPRLSAAKRMSTNSPLQRLFFLNNEFVWRQAEALAERLRRFDKTHRAQIKHAYELLYGREATDDDVKLGVEILGSLDQQSALERYAHILMSSNEFLFVD